VDNFLDKSSSVKKSFVLTLLPEQPYNVNNEDQDDSTSIDICNASLNESNEFFKVPESPQKESVMNIVEELLEASSDIHQVEQLDFSERRTATKSEELEKNFRERMEVMLEHI
jgi:hypothetical protein